MAGTHSLKGSLLRLQYADEDFELNKLLLRFSPKMDWELVQLYLERTLQRQDFSIEATDSSAVVTFNQGHSKKGSKNDIHYQYLCTVIEVVSL